MGGKLPCSTYISPKMCLFLGLPLSCGGNEMRDFWRETDKRDYPSNNLKMSHLSQSENVIKARFGLIESSCLIFFCLMKLVYLYIFFFENNSLRKLLCLFDGYGSPQCINLSFLEVLSNSSIWSSKAWKFATIFLLNLKEFLVEFK